MKPSHRGLGGRLHRIPLPTPALNDRYQVTLIQPSIPHKGATTTMGTLSTLSSPTYHFLGLRVNALTKSELLHAIQEAIDTRRENCIIGNHNLHSVYLFQRDEAMRRFYERNLYTHIDGMSLILLARLLGLDLKRRNKTSYLDWFDDFLHMAEEQFWKIYFVGGTPEVSETLQQVLNRTYPELKVRTHHGYDGFDPNTTIFDEIKAFAPHIVIVGMGMPLQERWIVHASTRLQVNLFMPCGAMLDFIAGAQTPSPRWLGNVGLEWLFRFVHRPSALAQRYFQEPLHLLPLMLKSMWRGESHVHHAWQTCPLCDGDPANMHEAGWNLTTRPYGTNKYNP